MCLFDLQDKRVDFRFIEIWCHNIAKLCHGNEMDWDEPGFEFFFSGLAFSSLPVQQWPSILRRSVDFAD